MNKITTALVISASMLLLGGCAMNNDINPGPEQSFQEENTFKQNEAKALTEDEITAVLYEKFGTEDPETGFTFSFSIVGEVMIDEKPYYHGRWSWLVTDEKGNPSHLSLLSEFFISQDGKEMYTGTYDYQEEKASLDDGKNLFEE